MASLGISRDDMFDEAFAKLCALCRSQKLKGISASHTAALQKAICVVQEVFEERKTNRLDTVKSLISRQLRNGTDHVSSIDLKP